MKAYTVAITGPPRSRKPIRGSAIRHKPRKRQIGDNPAFRAFVRTFGCVACFGKLVRDFRWMDAIEPDVTMWSRQRSPTEAAHCGPRALSRKASDDTCLPLCAIEHHRVGPESHHKLGKRFWGFHGLDRSVLIKQMQSLWAEESTRSVLDRAR